MNVGQALVETDARKEGERLRKMTRKRPGSHGMGAFGPP